MEKSARRSLLWIKLVVPIVRIARHSKVKRVLKRSSRPWVLRSEQGWWSFVGYRAWEGLYAGSEMQGKSASTRLQGDAAKFEGSSEGAEREVGGGQEAGDRAVQQRRPTCGNFWYVFINNAALYLI